MLVPMTLDRRLCGLLCFAVLTVAALAVAVGCVRTAPGSGAGVPPQPTTAESKVEDEAEKPAAPESDRAARERQDPPSSSLRQVVLAEDRSEADRRLDAGRQPVKMLEFFGIEPGMRVAELAAGGGYTTELLARAVGPQGIVYGQNTPFILERFAEEPWSERLNKPVMNNVVRIDSELEDPFPSELANLDAVLMILFYHDTVWFGTDRQAMIRAVYDVLKPGGIFGIVDHSAREGDGVSQAKNLHRIEEKVVVLEVEAAGFNLEKRGSFLKNPDDPRDWDASPSAAGERRGTSDRFVLLFRKPQADSGENGPGASSSQARQESSEPAREKQDEPGEARDDSSAPATGQQGSQSHQKARKCPDKRAPLCTQEYRPVCALVDTHIRCIRPPCPSTKRKTYSNACKACADRNVIQYVPGACSDEEKSSPPPANSPPPAKKK